MEGGGRRDWTGAFEAYYCRLHVPSADRLNMSRSGGKASRRFGIEPRVCRTLSVGPEELPDRQFVGSPRSVAD
jgi:hypothetical protein